MPKRTYIWRDSQFIEITEQLAAYKPKPRIHVISDDLGREMFHPANGRHYESKSAFRKVTKDHGCSEIGDSAPERCVFCA